MANLQGKQAAYFDEATTDFELATKGGDAAVLATILYHTKKLRDGEQDAA